MHLGQWFIHVHNVLHWWVPGVLALYFAIIPWVLDYPSRHYDEICGDADYTFSGPQLLFIYGLIGFYGLWFALPHTGTEILFLILATPFALFWLIIIGVNWIGQLLDQLDYNRDDWINKGLSYAEWEIYQHRLKRRDEALQSQLFKEQQMSAISGQDIRKTRFRVMTGGKKGAGK
ncbi:MAG: hypothetical protein K6T83_21135 [Alicyclobacillus sp.]|nr:hypothetical protein [Alicyclobacillus sp.]